MMPLAAINIDVPKSGWDKTKKIGIKSNTIGKIIFTILLTFEICNLW